MDEGLLGVGRHITTPDGELFLPGNERHGNREHGHVPASQQVFRYCVLFFEEPVVNPYEGR